MEAAQDRGRQPRIAGRANHPPGLLGPGTGGFCSPCPLLNLSLHETGNARAGLRRGWKSSGWRRNRLKPLARRASVRFAVFRGGEGPVAPSARCGRIEGLGWWCLNRSVAAFRLLPRGS